MAPTTWTRTSWHAGRGWASGWRPWGPSWRGSRPTRCPDLCRQEELALGASHARASRLRDVLLRHARRSDRWRRWAPDAGDPDVQFADARWADRVLGATAHACFRREDVREARQRLYANCVLLDICADPHGTIKARIGKRLRDLFGAFNLRDLDGGNAVA